MSEVTRRDLLGSAAMVGGWMLLGSEAALAQPSPAAQPAPAAQPGQPTPGAQPAATQPGAAPAAGDVDGPYKLPPLPYGYGDLEPFLNVQTMKLHHDIHHAGYVKGANTALADLENIRRTGGESIKGTRAATERLAFNLSGHVLHTLFWNSMTKNGGGKPDGEIGKLIQRDFGSYDAFRANLAAVAAQVQGSGWGVLVYEPMAQRLLVLQAEKHENSSVWGSVPLLALDVWEHAYYLQYQNKRTDFINAFMEVIDWQKTDQRLHAAMKSA